MVMSTKQTKHPFNTRSVWFGRPLSPCGRLPNVPNESMFGMFGVFGTEESEPAEADDFDARTSRYRTALDEASRRQPRECPHCASTRIQPTYVTPDEWDCSDCLTFWAIRHYWLELGSEMTSSPASSSVENGVPMYASRALSMISAMALSPAPYTSRPLNRLYSAGVS